MTAKATREEQQSYLQMKIAQQDRKDKIALEARLLIEIKTLKALQAAYKLQQLTGLKINFK